MALNNLDFVEACRKLIALDTTPSSSTKESVHYLASVAKDFGLVVDLQHDLYRGLEQWNFIARPVEGRPDSELLLETHLDTPEPGPYQQWQKTQANPFDATIIDGRLYGLGAADTKIDILCKLFAMADFSNVSRWKLPPVVVGTHSEESGMGGALKLIRQNKISAKYALIGEPTNLQLIAAGKGIAHVEIRVPFSQAEISYRQDHDLQESTSTQSKFFVGKAAHSSHPEQGESAINKMLDFMLQLPNNVAIMSIEGGTNFNSVPSHALLELDYGLQAKNLILERLVAIYKEINALDKDFHQYNDPEFSPAHPTLNIGLINTLDDCIILKGNARFPPVVTTSIYEDWIQRLKSVCARHESEFRVLDYKKPYRTSANSIFLKACGDELNRMGLNANPSTQSSTTEASIFSRMGVDCVCFGPGQSEDNAHTPNESVELRSLELAQDFYKKIIQRVCL